MTLTLLLGGARSGKSRLAQGLASTAPGAVTVIATAEARDDEMAARIAAHRRERPPGWTTVEEPLELASALAAVEAGRTVVVDCLTVWVSNLLEQTGAVADVVERGAAAAAVASARAGSTIAVSNEVGLGIVPEAPLVRAYRDALGEVNRLWADAAERAWLVVAGRLLPLAPAGTILGRAGDG
ncbi:MAG TPA: bifunctional adenosylcobinamide kinase/adenosylcobinamide-phosphate guanylyltransferase [Gaiellaceae bacterium]|nr:bifunctional adenosylcobinamide kinase/adenosylcobinamide-phosphate guanylyltransferase [Gaiellaceae bacterium]